MAALGIRLNAGDVAKLSSNLNRIVRQAENLVPAMETIGEYMVRSTQNRILRSKTSPEGDRWARLSELTTSLKGHDQPLFHSGRLAESIKVKNVSNRGVTIYSSAPYAGYMQSGVRKVKGKYRSKKPAPQIPARPFMGFSQENLKRISQILRKHVFEQ